MTKKDNRNLIAYGSNLPKVEWPNKARIAVQIVLNYEEGAENCVLNGDKNSEVFLSEIIGAQPIIWFKSRFLETSQSFSRKRNSYNYFWSWDGLRKKP